ncbi:6-carboxytetrahydropterin synthase QueD [Treponema pectinovorum]|uniref:6-carboxytetrahydropterin synthase QueD n=1 Tax=Treponema pectinovorum TaxID=164 RepID=UPI0011C78BA6|nr:6-carboxytetrahydropterin synthase QueD [Treponema pectinovorum]
MFEVRVTDDFAAAHFLRDYHGKCENLHGHNYKVYVHVEGRTLDDGGMLLDFTVLKSALKQVLSKIDHTNLNDIKEFDQNPSAEKIAMYIYNQMLVRLKEKNIDLSQNSPSGTKISKVDVFETERNRARYKPE